MNAAHRMLRRRMLPEEQHTAAGAPGCHAKGREKELTLETKTRTVHGHLVK